MRRRRRARCPIARACASPIPRGNLRGGMLVTVTVQKEKHVAIDRRSANRALRERSGLERLHGRRRQGEDVAGSSRLADRYAGRGSWCRTLAPGTPVITTQPDALQDGSVVAVNGARRRLPVRKRRIDEASTSLRIGLAALAVVASGALRLGSGSPDSGAAAAAAAAATPPLDSRNDACPFPPVFRRDALGAEPTDAVSARHARRRSPPRRAAYRIRPTGPRFPGVNAGYAGAGSSAGADPPTGDRGRFRTLASARTNARRRRHSGGGRPAGARRPPTVDRGQRRLHAESPAAQRLYDDRLATASRCPATHDHQHRRRRVSR